MKIYFEGDQEKCSFHLPVVKSIAARFEKFCVARKLKQNFSHFTIGKDCDVAISYIYGMVEVLISAPFDIVLNPVGGEEEVKKDLPIWIKYFDEVVIGAYNGMFLGLTSTMKVQYLPSELVKNSIETNITDSTEAELCCGYSVRDSITLRYLIYALSTSNIVAAIQYGTDGYYYRTYSSLEDEVLTGLKASAFLATGDGDVHFTLGGDHQYPEFESESTGSFTAPGTGDPVYIHNVAWSFIYSSPAWGAFPADTPIAWPFESWFDGPTFASTLWSGFKGIMSQYVHATLAASNLVFEMGEPVWDENTSLPYGDGGHEYWFNTISKTTGVVVIKVNQINTDGELSSCDIVLYDSVNAINRFTRDIFVAQVQTLPEPNLKHVYYWHHTGPYVPENFFAAPRNYISMYGYAGMASTYQRLAAAFAFDDSSGSWKECNFLAKNPILWSEDCHTYVGIEGEREGTTYWTTFSVYRRTYDLITSTFSYVSVLDYRTTNHVVSSLMYGYLPVHTILYPCGDIVSVYGASDPDKNGIYRIDGLTADKIYDYTLYEIEPVFVSHDGTVVVTKTKIFLPGKTITCTECCGIYLDYTHYVDRIAPALFVIKSVLDNSIVDSTVNGLYNFYEFSEDTSVCVLSKFVKYSSDDPITGPAIVIDFADKVYRFEPSDVYIVQQLNENTFQSSTENDVYGYPGGIPYGARYRGTCNCECLSYDMDVIPRQHYIYCTPPGGYTYHILNFGCVLCNTAKVGGGGNNPTRIVDEEIRLNKTVVPQYLNASKKRDTATYDEVRLNKYIYHHVGKILRRRDPGLTEIPDTETIKIGVNRGNPA